MTYDEFFQIAMGGEAGAVSMLPYPYQSELATGDVWPELLTVPTGVGKTAAVVLGWLYRRQFAADAIGKATPRRLVYCLPMRTLVEQTRDECLKWLDRLGLITGEVEYADAGKSRVQSYSLKPGDEDDKDRVAVHLLMGGADLSDWDAHPECDAIIIGTQDMLLSRALNRGYGMSRYRWPMHFGLLNNDCLWVLDETQLMGVGVTTSCQLAGLREKLGAYGKCQTLWMSATLDNDALATVDHSKPDPDTAGLTLGDEDQKDPRVAQLLMCAKPVAMAATKLDAATAEKKYKVYRESLANEVLERHRAGTLTLVVINNVDRSQKLFGTLQECLAKKDLAPELCLIHSRFRPEDRQRTQARALDESSIAADGPGRIVVATQAIEAGVDISATTMFTELAPWSSLVQRFGRCNRRGLCGTAGHEPAAVFCVDIDTSDGKKSKLRLPYEPGSLDVAREQLVKLDDVGLESLKSVIVEEVRPIEHVLRRKDLLDLFDTTPDLSGNDLDVSRYIRNSDDTDVQVYWRDWDLKEFPKQPPRPGRDRTADSSEVEFPAAQRNELCSVSIGQMKDFAAKLKQKLAWCWDPLNREWHSVGKSDVRPGMTILLHVAAGGYDAQIGWTAEVKHQPVPVEHETSLRQPLDAMNDDDTKGSGRPVELTQHLNDVVAAAESLKQHSSFDAEIPWLAIITAARWHDVGKAHAAFQAAMRDCDLVTARGQTGDLLWAKSGKDGMPWYRIEAPDVGDQSASNDQSVADDRLAVDDLDVSDKTAGLNADGVTEDSSNIAVLESPHPAATSQSNRPQSRRGFRHELVSALAWLAHNAAVGNNDAAEIAPVDADSVNLIAYLIAAHHGKVRLSIRSMPNEPRPRDSSKKFARGIWEGDEMPTVDLGNGEWSSSFEVSLDLMSLGESEQGVSWLARTLALRDADAHGPFRLAFLETLLRIADWRGSAAGEETE